MKVNLMLQSMMGKERFFQGIAVSESDFILNGTQ